MDYKMRERYVLQLLKVPPIRWPSLLKQIRRKGNYNSSDMDDRRRTMDSICEQMAFLSEYVTKRFGCDGCGESTTKEAVKAAQKQQAKVNRALGYKLRTPFFSSTTPDEN